MGEFDAGDRGVEFLSPQYLYTEGPPGRGGGAGGDAGERLWGLGGWGERAGDQMGRPVKRRKAKPLLPEEKNEMRMKIDEAERKGDSFHQQVCQMKLR